MDERSFEEIEHTADIAIRVWGQDLAKLFANAAYGMASQLTDASDVPVTTEKAIALDADDVEILLVEWLSELLYLGETENLVFVTFDFSTVTLQRLRAVVGGGPLVERHAHIKAVTFSELDVRRTEDGYETVIVFDV